MSCLPTSTHMLQSCRLVNEGLFYANPSFYRKIVGKLLQLSNARPDIAFIVQQLSQFLKAPTGLHMTTGKGVLQYLKRIIGQGFFYAANSACQLHAYYNADWATRRDTR